MGWSRSMSPKALLTGASGFLGRYLRAALAARGYQVVGLGRGEDQEIRCDLTTQIPDLGDHYFDLVVHAAGKAHVNPRSEDERKAFHQVNLEGTRGLTVALDALKPAKGFVFISTVAVYGRDTGENIAENEPLVGETPYAASKIEAERYLSVWATAKQVPLLILRPPLIAGVHPPGNLGDMLRALEKGYYMRIGGGTARRSWVWAQDIAELAARAEGLSGVYNLSDGRHPSFREIEAVLKPIAGRGARLALPMVLARLMALGGDMLGAVGFKSVPFDGNRLAKMSESLTFDDAKARAELHWQPHLVGENAARIFH